MSGYQPLNNYQYPMSNIQFPMKSKHSDKLKIILLSLFLFTLTSIFLLGGSSALNLAESKITYASNQLQSSDSAQNGDVAGASTGPEVQVTDLKILPPKFTSGAVLAEDISINKVLFAKNIHDRMSPASTTKIMTALVSFDYFKPGDVLTVPEGAMVGGSTMGLYAGEIMTYRSLLYGMLLNSGNDAAYTIALNYPGGMSVFVDEMNERVARLNLKDTHFQNPAGFDNPNHYSSAYDLSEIAKEAIKNSTLSRVVSTKETSVMSFDKVKTHSLKNLNKLLSETGVLGIKTGFTEKSGENLVALVDRNGHKILTVMLNSQDRFGESKNLIDWIFQNFVWSQ